ncbi:anthranilate synthase component I family protein [Desulfuribacillus alkaliarsenatis]|uniref:Aminodeoxychorismate synthase n=1 Tax=Desulfuribacillus alkaliarsenatis TaxID=766136 RepID=A0A1E5G5J6_9FIRM|nr:anthranilate synthase component I family protein [Desulfuribacillus alkaliarsenatis]OEF98462.1 hypothetical protein BHF68_01950 [Desulfuribacillus alkaliarsenatis]
MKHLIDETSFDKLCLSYSVVPLIKKIKLTVDVLSVCERFNNEYQMLLHSPKSGRYSFYAVEMTHLYVGHKDKLEVKNLSEKTSEVLNGDPLASLEKCFMKYNSPKIVEAPPFYGGLIGYISYDVIRLIENIPNDTVDDIGLSLFYFANVSDGLAIDHQQQELYIFANRLKQESYSELLERVENIEKRISNTTHRATNTAIGSYNHQGIKSAGKYYETSFTEEQFCQAVDKVIEYIKAGDVFQVNLSLRRGTRINRHPLEIYRELVKRNPSPYMAYIQTPDFAIASSSPELLIKVKDEVIETRPIAGTRSRGRTEAEEQQLMNELLTNEKELAEHIMLVDLERNDLGRVSEYGSVEVNELLVLEKYSHVIHLVSNVRGKLIAGNSLFDVIRAVFPGGTITGAPKVRTMEIIEELEPVKRGLYTGSIGWLGYQQEMELNIVIRTAVFKDGWAFVQAGAGIVYDSIPHREYKESLKKARALWDILEELYEK